MTEQRLEDVNPTRMDLLEIRKKLSLAEKGYTLLEEKRDTLVEKFFEVISKRNTLKTTVEKQFATAFTSLIKAQMLLGENQVEDAASLTDDAAVIDFDQDNIMGVKIPKMKTTQSAHTAHPNYGFSETSAALDEAYTKFNELLRQLLEIAEIEAVIKSLSIEIEKTKRRVNVLENILIPRLHATIKYIEMQLDEREREDFFRRKRIKALMEEKKETHVT